MIRSIHPAAIAGALAFVGDTALAGGEIGPFAASRVQKTAAEGPGADGRPPRTRSVAAAQHARPQADARRVPLPIQPLQTLVLDLARSSGTRLIGDVASLGSLTARQPPAHAAPPVTLDQRWALLLEGRVHHARQCRPGACTVWLAGAVVAAPSISSVPGRPGGPQPWPVAAPLQADPPGLFPSD